MAAESIPSLQGKLQSIKFVVNKDGSKIQWNKSDYIKKLALKAKKALDEL